MICGTARLPYRALPTPEQVRETLDSMGENDERINLERLIYDHYQQLERLMSSGATEHPSHYELPITMISLGDVLFIPFPYEIFSEIVLRLRQYIPLPYVLCLSNTNGYNGYFPSQDQICRGGYEVECFRSGSVYTLTDDADQKLINEVLRIWKERK